MTKEVLAEIITIGDEILIGQIVDSNSAWIGKQLSDVGVRVKQITSISDDKQHILKAVEEAESRVDVILITGGLGPTKDDITKKTLAEYFNSEMIQSTEVLENIKAIYSSKGRVLNELTFQQALVPEVCEVLDNKKGTAPGMLFNKNDKIFVSMPGVPFEMKFLMQEYVIPRIKQQFSTPVIVHKTIRTVGFPESELAIKLEDWENSIPEQLSLAYLPSPGIVKLRLTGRGGDKNELEELIENKFNALKPIIGNHIYGENEDRLEEVIVPLLIDQKATLATAESCTGGYIAHLITSVSGSSNYFQGSVISYSNEVKQNNLSVDAKVLEKYGAVSEEVVKQMAEGARKHLKTDYAIACSGIAGPTGGTETKPVGLIWIAVATPNRVITKECRFGNNRTLNIRLTAAEALNLLRLELL